MALEDQDLDNQDDDVAVRCRVFCNPDMSWPLYALLYACSPTPKYYSPAHSSSGDTVGQNDRKL